MKDVYIITGATGGIGSEIAKNITKKGIVLISDLYEDELIKLQKKINSSSVKCEYLKCDVSKLKDVKELAKKVKSLGKFKAMLHTAGVSGTMSVSKRIMDINLIGTKYLMDEFLKIADNSVFINYASMAGHMVPDSFLYDKTLLDPLADNFWDKMKLFCKDPQAAYAFSKKGVILLTERDASKWADKNSRLLSISPGTIETPMLLQEAKESASVDLIVKHSPIPRYGTPKEVAKLTNYLISDDAAFTTGVDYLIDGGATSMMKYNDIFGRKRKPKKLFLFLICLFVFIGLPFVTTFINCSNYYYITLFIINMLTIIFGTIYALEDDISIIIISIPVLLYLLSGFIPGFYIDLVNIVFILIIAYLVQLLVLIFKLDKQEQKK